MRRVPQLHRGYAMMLSYSLRFRVPCETVASDRSEDDSSYRVDRSEVKIRWMTPLRLGRDLIVSLHGGIGSSSGF
jgi:hypothetical protein